MVNLIGTATDSVNSDDLVTRLAEIVPDCCTLLMTIDACGSGNFAGSLRRHRGTMNYGVVLTTPATADDTACPRAFFDTGTAVTDGLAGTDAVPATPATATTPATPATPAVAPTADADGDGTITVAELVADIAAEPRHGFSSHTFWDDEHSARRVNGRTFVDLDPPAEEEEVPEAEDPKPADKPDKPKDKADDEGCSSLPGGGWSLAALLGLALSVRRRARPGPRAGQ